jgi:hypothetical protein
MGWVIGIVAAIAVIGLLVVFAFAGNVLRKKDTASDGEVGNRDRAANAETADYILDFDVVCGDGSVSNAATYREPYRVVAFNEGPTDDDWHQLTLDHRASYYADTDAMSSINVVACLSRKPGSEVKSGTCEVETAGKRVEMDHYAVEYDVELREALTGRSIERLGTVSGPATRCPFIAFFDRDSQRIYGDPDAEELDAKLAEFVAG